MSVERIDLQQVRNAIDRGDKATGRRLLERLLENNPHSEAAWLWMSTTVVDDLEEERDCLNKALEINPSSARAQRRWFELQGILVSPVGESNVPVSAQQASRPKQPERRKWTLLIVALVAVALIVASLFLVYPFFA